MRFTLSRGLISSVLSSLLICACATACLTACEDEALPPPPVQPEVTAIKVQCRPVNGVYTLDLIEVSVRDLDGVEDIVDDPIVIIEANRFTLDRTNKPWDAEANPDLVCKTESCEIDYVWEFQSGETEQIFCGADADSLILQATVDVRDALGLAARVRESARPL
ncbi:MAG: hypothetical protein ACI9U2_001004 [Bradymonadia bacterium]|jgi:hypothetical protein